MPEEIILKIKELAEAGATVIAPQPLRDPGLRNYPQCDSVAQETANYLWREIDGIEITENRVGKGRVIYGKTIRNVLLADGIPPDFEVAKENMSSGIR